MFMICRILCGLLTNALPMLWRHFEHVHNQLRQDGEESHMDREADEREAICRKVSGSTGKHLPDGLNSV
jgi:hypothetical protein